MTTLDKLNNDDEAIVKDFLGGLGIEEKLNLINIRKGKKIKKIVSQPLSGPVIILIDNRQCAIGHNMAKKIAVEKI